MDLAERYHAALDAIIDGKLPWSILDDLDGRGHRDALEELRSHGLVEFWREDGRGVPLAGGALVTLSPAGADLKRVELVEHAEGYPVWEGVRAGKDGLAILDDRPVRLPRHRGEYPLPHPEMVEDPTPDAQSQAIEEEECEPVILWGHRIRTRTARVPGRKWHDCERIEKGA